MKNLNELYAKVMADETLKNEYIEAAENGKIEEFLKAHDCEATISEFDEFMSKAGMKNGELEDDELDNVAAGKKCGTVYKDGRPVVATFNVCDRYQCKTCGKGRGEVQTGSFRGIRFADGCSDHGEMCIGCKFCKYKGGLWLCYHPERVNN